VPEPRFADEGKLALSDCLLCFVAAVSGGVRSRQVGAGIGIPEPETTSPTVAFPPGGSVNAFVDGRSGSLPCPKPGYSPSLPSCGSNHPSARLSLHLRFAKVVPGGIREACFPILLRAAPPSLQFASFLAISGVYSFIRRSEAPFR